MACVIDICVSSAGQISTVGLNSWRSPLEQPHVKAEVILRSLALERERQTDLADDATCSVNLSDLVRQLSLSMEEDASKAGLSVFPINLP